MQMTGGQALVQALKRHGVDTLFLLPGVQLDFAVDALWEEQDSFTLYVTRHEEATAYMADGYARSTGKVGTCMVVPGAGLLNITGALATAYSCNSQVLCVAGQIPLAGIGAGRGLLHELKDSQGALASVVKFTERAETVAQIPDMVARAFQALETGRPRPVEIEIPVDVIEDIADVTLPELGAVSKADPAARGPGVDLDSIRQAAQILGQAAHPLICSGGGVLSAEAWAELEAVSALLEAPVLMTSNGRGAISDRDYRAHVGVTAARELIPQADVILAVGTRLLMMFQPNIPVPINPETKVIHINIDAADIGRNARVDIPIAADAKAALSALADALPDHNRRRPGRADELRAVQEKSRDYFARATVQSAYALAIRAELPDDGFVVTESTQVGFWCTNGGFPIYRPRGFVGHGYQGALGFGFATALGVQAGNPDQKVVSINGDGGFMYNVQELSTMAKYQLPLVVVVFNDNCYGNVDHIQNMRFNGHRIGADLLNPDFVKLAGLFGIAAERAESPDALRRALRRAFESAKPALIEVPMPPAAEMTGTMYFEPLAPRPKL